MTDTKLDPATLSAEERALWDALAVERVVRNSCRPEQAYEFTEDCASRLILARRALFAPATEKACTCGVSIIETEGGEIAWERHTCEAIKPLRDAARRVAAMYHPAKEKVETTADRIAADLKAGTFRGAQPEPAALVNGHTPIGEYDPDMKPAAQEYRFCRNGCGAQVTFINGVTGPCPDCDKPAAPVNVGYQPIDRGEIKSPPQGGTGTVRPAAPEMPEAVYIAANTLRASGHVTLADALLKEAWHSQPVAVGMTPELSELLSIFEAGAGNVRSLGPDWHESADRSLKLAAAVRQQAAQGRKVELGKVRELILWYAT